MLIKIYTQAPVVVLHVPLPPVDFVHFFLGFPLTLAGSQTPVALHRAFLTQAGTEPAGRLPHGLEALTNLHLLVQQNPPSHCSLPSFTPSPQREVPVCEWVAVPLAVPVPDPVPVGLAVFD